MKTKNNRMGRETGVGIRDAIEEIKRRNNHGARKMSVFAPLNEGKKSDISLLLVDYLRGGLKAASAVCALILASSALADQVQDFGYSVYAGNSGLVTVAQKQQAAEERQAARDFRNISIADRWDQSDKGSLASRWSDAGPGSIAARWK